ncbi:MAG: hypothetical protein CMI18_05645 [Opitutaceae bacterium]|nr:hypothetical protein [Opitutaceae bacterium]
MTVIPDDYVEFLSEYPQVVNRHVVNVSKRSFSFNILGADANLDGPLIVKNDRSFFVTMNSNLIKIEVFQIEFLIILPLMA